MRTAREQHAFVRSDRLLGPTGIVFAGPIDDHAKVVVRAIEEAVIGGWSPIRSDPMRDDRLHLQLAGCKPIERGDRVLMVRSGREWRWLTWNFPFRAAAQPQKAKEEQTSDLA